MDSENISLFSSDTGAPDMESKTAGIPEEVKPDDAQTKGRKKQKHGDSNKGTTRGKRVTLLFNETTWDFFLTLCATQEQSANDVLNTYVERVVDDNKEIIQRIREIRSAAKF